MTTVTAQQLFDDVASMIGWDADDLDVRQWRDLRDALSAALAEVWEERNAWWPEIMRVEHLALVDDWSLERITVLGPYQVGDVVFWPDDGGYYMAIAGVSAEPPASYNTLTGEWEETAGRWKLLDADYLDATDYVPGMPYPDTVYTVNSVFRFDDRYWLPTAGLVASGIQDHSPGRYPDQWIELPVLDTVLRRVGYGRPPIGAVRSISRRSPIRYQYSGDYEWQEAQDDFRIFDFEGPRCWVDFRLVTPQLDGDLFDATVAYTSAPLVQQIYETVLSAEATPGTLKVATPVILPSSGSFTGSQVVTITCATAGASIRYTTDGSTPTSTTGTPYAGQFTLTDTATVKARAFLTGYSDSDTATATLTRAAVIYHGSAESATLDAAGVLALAGTRTGSDPAGVYSFDAPGAPEKYLYFAWPGSLTRQPAVGTGFTSSGFPVALAEAAEGYTEQVNGWYYAEVTVGGVLYRVFRTYYTQAGALTVTVATSS